MHNIHQQVLDRKVLAVSNENTSGEPLFTMNMNHALFAEGQLKEMARHAITHLFSLCQDEGSGHTVGIFSLDSQMKVAGFSSNIAPFTFFMYHLGILKRLRRSGKSTGYRFFVANPDLFDSLVTDETVGLAREAVRKHLETNQELSRLKKKVEALPATPAGPDSEHLEAMAEMVATIERLQAQLTASNARVVELEASQPTATATADALIARFRSTQTA